MIRCFAFLGVSMLPQLLFAHHSPNVHFDRGDVVEVSGTLTEV
ncbi:MAG: hypothetical protein ACJ0SL_05095 [Candidatus Rariloculaceae bacterium]